MEAATAPTESPMTVEEPEREITLIYTGSGRDPLRVYGAAEAVLTHLALAPEDLPIEQFRFVEFQTPEGDSVFIRKNAPCTVRRGNPHRDVNL